MTLHVAAIDAVPWSGQQIRLAHAALLTPSTASALTARSGLLAGGTITATATPSMAISVAPFSAAVQLSSGIGGAALVTNDAPATVAVDPSTSLARRDRIVLRVYPETAAVGSRRAELDVIAGVPAASNPALPALPSDALDLGEINLTANAPSVTASMLLPRRVFTAAAGGIAVSLNGSDVAGVYQGQPRYRLDTGSLEFYNGTSAWDVYGAPPAWQAYSPTWTAAAGGWSRGNGTLEGAYYKVGRSCTVRVTMTIGSTTNLGSGNYSVTLPFAASSTAQQSVPATFIAGGLILPGVALFGAGAADTSLWFQSQNGTNDMDIADSVYPLPLTSGYRMHLQGTYETGS